MIFTLEDLRARAVAMGVCLIVAAFVVVVTRVVVRAIVYRKSQPPRRRIPWRFSLMSVAVLASIAAVVLGLFRHEPFSAVFATCILALLWLPIAGFLEFRRELADRRTRELQAALDETSLRAEKGSNENGNT